MVTVGVPVPTKARVKDSLNILVLVRQVLQPFGTYWMLPFASIVTKAVPFTVFIDETEYVTLPCGCTASVRQKALHRFSTIRAAYCWLVAAIAIGVNCIMVFVLCWCCRHLSSPHSRATRLRVDSNRGSFSAPPSRPYQKRHYRQRVTVRC